MLAVCLLLRYFTFIYTIIPTISRIIRISAIGANRGDNTNHQDQVITPHNFNTMKATSNNNSTLGL